VIEEKYAVPRACIFDAYGTLLDIQRLQKSAEKAFGETASLFIALWRQKQLEYSWVETIYCKYRDFAALAYDALNYTLDAFGIRNTALRDELFSNYFRLDPFPDAVPILSVLRQQRIPLGVLTNGSYGMLEEGLRYAKIHGLFDIILSVDEVRAYKPHPSVYRLASERFRLAPHEIVFVSANGWDCAGADAAGLSVLHLKRHKSPIIEYQLAHVPIIESLERLPALLAAPISPSRQSIS
jgi:2-haloacid dehalogenase